MTNKQMLEIIVKQQEEIKHLINLLALRVSFPCDKLTIPCPPAYPSQPQVWYSADPIYIDMEGKG